MVEARKVSSVVQLVESGIGVMIEVQIEMLDLADVGLGSAACVRLQRDRRFDSTRHAHRPPQRNCTDEPSQKSFPRRDTVAVFPK